MNIITKIQHDIPCAIIGGEEFVIHSAQDALDLIAAVQYKSGCERIVLGKDVLDEGFFQLHSGLASEILQKFAQYQIKLAIVGDFSRYCSKALKDFIHESNQGAHILFAATEEEAIKRLCAVGTAWRGVTSELKNKAAMRLSKISTFHYARLIFRSTLFVAAILMYILGRVHASQNLLERVANHPIVLAVIWLVFGLEMILRFFPSKLESMGCQKQFPQNFMPTDTAQPSAAAKRRNVVSVLIIAAFWILLNGAIGTLYYLGMIDAGILLLICLAFSVCDMICILFFCPFQTWVMKNKCCGSCRIYNWDYAMMFTPLVFVRGPYTWGLLALSLGLLLKWEIVYRRHPERFYESSNQRLSCGQCQEKLCAHKKSLQRFLKQYRSIITRFK